MFACSSKPVKYDFTKKSNRVGNKRSFEHVRVFDNAQHDEGAQKRSASNQYLSIYGELRTLHRTMICPLLRIPQWMTIATQEVLRQSLGPTPLTWR